MASFSNIPHKVVENSSNIKRVILVSPDIWLLICSSEEKQMYWTEIEIMDNRLMDGRIDL